MKQTCSTCSCYLTDEDKDGNVTEYFHDKNKDEGFCAIKELFTVRKKNNAACPAYVSDEGDRNGIIDTVGRYG